MKRAFEIPIPREIYQWDHDLATFVPMGRATVSEDGALLVSDTGSGITKAGWGGGPFPNSRPVPIPPKCAVPRKPDPDKCEVSFVAANGCEEVRVEDPKLKVRMTGPDGLDDRDPPLPPESNIKTAIVRKGGGLFAVVATTANPRVGNVDKIKWRAVTGSGKAAGIKDVEPADMTGQLLYFNIDNIPSTTGSSDKSEEIVVTIEGNLCGKNASATIYQDEKDVIRQEYADFKDQPYGGGVFRLSMPDRSALLPLGTYTPGGGAGPIGTLSNPYKVGLGDPFQRATSIAQNFNQAIKSFSRDYFDTQIAGTTDSMRRVQLEGEKQNYQNRNYYPQLNSVYRSPRHNLASGSTASCSNHMAGAAVDLLLLGYPILADAQGAETANMNSAKAAWRALRDQGVSDYGRAACEKRGDKIHFFPCPGDPGGLSLTEVSIIHADRGPPTCN